MDFLFVFIIIITIFISILNSFNNYKDVDSLLKKVFVSQRFANIKLSYSQGNLRMIRADAQGENYLFVYKPSYLEYTATDIETINTIAKNMHVHSIVIATFVPVSSNPIVEKMIKAAKISIWDFDKLVSLAKSTDSSVSKSNPEFILKTSDTSDDTCHIDLDYNDPIQDGSTAGFLSKLFDKPTHL